MANIFSVYGSIFIDNEKANKSIDETKGKAETQSKSMGQNFANVAKSAAVIGSAVVGAAGAVGAGAMAMVNKSAEAADQIDKLSERTGINREELQRWKHAADQSGANVENFSTGVKKMSSVIADANNGNKAAQDTLTRLGLSYQELGNMPIEQAFDKVTSSLADMEDGANRNALGNDVLGKSYTDMLPLLNAGSDGIAGLKKEADDLGLVMSESSVKAGVKFGDTLANVKDSATALLNKIGTSLMPVIQEILDMIIDNMPIIQGIFATIAPILTTLFSGLMPPLIQLGKDLFPIIINLIMQIIPPIMQIVSALLPVITQLITMLLPPIIQIVSAILPALLNLIMPLFPLLEPILNLLQPFIDLILMIIQPLVELINMVLPPIIQLFTYIINLILPPLQTALELVANILTTVFSNAFKNLTPIFESFRGYLSGLINFITGIFSGDWEKAWNGVKEIFSGIVKTFTNIFKMPINFIIDNINSFIKSINKIKMPDWVPKVGGKGFNIPTMTKLRIGMDYVPYDEFPALLHKGEQVLTVSEANEYRNGRNISNNDLAPILERIFILLSDAFPELKKSMNINLVLDDDTLVSKITPKIDNKLGSLHRQKARGV